MAKRLALASLALAALACGSPCQDLAARICSCQTLGAPRDNCNTSVKNQISNGAQQPTDADQQYCQQKLATCPDPLDGPMVGDAYVGCFALHTPAGKAACGLAYDPATP